MLDKNVQNRYHTATSGAHQTQREEDTMTKVEKWPCSPLGARSGGACEGFQY